LPEQKKARLIAFYLPQYHPIPENDLWWGKGFTEWTNAAKAKPLYDEHYQPHLPADLGFYDLRVSETRLAQAELAQEYGIEGFCYWHYWFAGKRLLERPFAEVLKSGEPSLPFCLGWANDSWSGIWQGCPDRVLIEQTYPGEADDKAHFDFVLQAFSDQRYIKMDGKPAFLVYKPYHLPEPNHFIERWQKWAVEAGLKGIFFLAHVNSMQWDAAARGFDGIVPHNPGITTWYHFNPVPELKSPSPFVRRRRPDVMDYSDYIKLALPTFPQGCPGYPCVLPNWDNTPRCGTSGMVLEGSDPRLFQSHLASAIELVSQRDFDKRIIFIKSWNEWGEGNYLEPDQKYGRQYLEACRGALTPA
jgi:lipopolysaccharide biosynthesis protein